MSNSFDRCAAQNLFQMVVETRLNQSGDIKEAIACANEALHAFNLNFPEQVDDDR